ncbi:MAG: hypothetical protein VXY56_10970, partial [Pseudomonadota bacterium]|nr:hypothetical protein [Pseudomonadota bacterium]
HCPKCQHELALVHSPLVKESFAVCFLRSLICLNSAVPLTHTVFVTRFMVEAKEYNLFVAQEAM